MIEQRYDMRTTYLYTDVEKLWASDDLSSRLTIDGLPSVYCQRDRGQ